MTWSQQYTDTDTQRLGDRKEKQLGGRSRNGEDRETEISREAERRRESKAKGDRVRQRMRSKQQEWGKQVTEESLLVSTLSSLVSLGFGPPTCYSLVSIATGRAAPNLHIHLHPFYLHNSTGFRAYS